MKIEAADFFYLSMPEVTTEGDGSQDALLVQVSAGAHSSWGECEAPGFHRRICLSHVSRSLPPSIDVCPRTGNRRSRRHPMHYSKSPVQARSNLTHNSTQKLGLP